MAPVTPTHAPPPPECAAPRSAASDPRAVALLGNAAASLAEEDHASAVAFLRAAASLGASPLDAAATRAALARLSLPVVVTPATSVHERSADGAVVAFIAPPEALGPSSTLATLCDDTPLEWADLARGTRGSVRLTPLAASEQLAPVLALDAAASAEGHLVRTLLSGEGQPYPEDHPLGPTRWDTPNHDSGATSDVPAAADLSAFLRSTGARTNLRVCPDDLRVVAVLPHPPADTVWADAVTCGRPPSPSTDGEWRCRGGEL